ncbi:MAG: hypothetical protein ACXAC2_03920, partial [Candidatus Kariarchaeaceae archaeon]
QNPNHELASRIEQIKSSQLKIGSTIREILKIKLHYHIAVSNIKLGNLEIAEKYLDECLDIEITQHQLYTYQNVLPRDYINQAQHYHQRIVITRKILVIQNKFSQLLELIKLKAGLPKITNLIAEIRNYVKSSDPQIELPYISAIPQIYNSILDNVELMISLNKDHEEIEYHYNSSLERFCERIENGTNQINSSLTSLVTESDKDNLNEIVNKNRKNSETLYMAILLLPSHIRENSKLGKRLECIINLCKSIENEIKALETNDFNKLQELIYKTWAFYFANQSYQIALELEDNLVPKDRIQSHFSGSYISAHTIQMHIYQLTVQYLCLSHVIPRLFFAISLDENVFSSNNEVLSNLLDIFEAFSPFIEMIDQIQNDCHSLLRHKDDMGTILAQVNWDQIMFRQKLISGIITFFESIKNAILGLWSSKLGVYDQASINLDDATGLSFKAAEQLQIDGDQVLVEFSTHVFSFAQFCQSMAQNTKKADLDELPSQSLFKLFRDMIFAI